MCMKTAMFPVLGVAMLSLSGPGIAAPALAGTAAETTADGLVLVDKARARVYVRPDAQLGRYTKIMIDPVTVSYRRPPPPSRGGQERDANFPLTPAQIERINATFQEVFAQAMSRPGGFAVVSAPAADVLRLRAGLAEVRVGVPTAPAVGRQDIYVESLGEATLAGELLDSQSGEVLARFADRQRVGEADNRMYKATPARSWVEVRKQLADWAARLRTLLDEARTW